MSFAGGRFVRWVVVVLKSQLGLGVVGEDLGDDGKPRGVLQWITVRGDGFQISHLWRLFVANELQATHPNLLMKIY